MGLVHFVLVNKEDDLIKKANTLKEIWQYIRLYINEPRSYDVDQVDEKGNIEDTTTAYYLIENFKTENSLPLLLTDINDNI